MMSLLKSPPWSGRAATRAAPSLVVSCPGRRRPWSLLVAWPRAALARVGPASFGPLSLVASPRAGGASGAGRKRAGLPGEALDVDASGSGPRPAKAKSTGSNRFAGFWNWQRVYGGTTARERPTLRERWLSTVRTQRSKRQALADARSHRQQTGLDRWTRARATRTRAGGDGAVASTARRRSAPGLSVEIESERFDGVSLARRRPPLV